jgi:hypothetical protein
MEKQTKDKSTSTMVKQGNATVSVKENQPSKSNDGGYIWLV